MNIFEIELQTLKFEEALLQNGVNILTVRKFLHYFQTEAESLLETPQRVEQWVCDFSEVICLLGKRASV